ncbi:MAG: hypothetical protein OXT67_04200 [Zetaproteobacteria bacterium]|nr:hypothetical protein [Zetaproteobacteria bacterium]
MSSFSSTVLLWLLLCHSSWWPLIASAPQPSKKPQKQHFNDLPGELQETILYQAIMTCPPTNLSRIALINQNSYQVFCRHKQDIYPRAYSLFCDKRAWITEAIQAAACAAEPKHLNTLLQLENWHFQQVFTKAHTSLKTAQEWQRHGVSLLITYAVACEIMNLYACHAVIQAMPHTHLSYSELKATQHATTKSATAKVAWHAATCMIGDTLIPFCYTAANLATTVGTDASPTISAILRQGQPITTAAAYRVAETSTWLSLLDPEKHDLYQNIYSMVSNKLKASDQANRCTWFSSVEHLEEHLDNHFGPHSRLAKEIGIHLTPTQYQQRYSFIAPYLQELRRVAHKVRELTSYDQYSRVTLENG